MLNITKLREKLLHQQKKVEEDLKSISKEDPVMDNGPLESGESGTDSWLADAHSQVVAMRNNLNNILSQTKKALLRMKKGNYGKCENCGKEIENARLEAMPSATLCIACSKKLSKK